MRWNVDISTLGKSVATPERRTVEASNWQNALKAVRNQTALDDALRSFSIEVLDDGVRAVDPANRLRYIVRRAPDSARPPPAAQPAAASGSTTQKMASVRPPAPAPAPKDPLAQTVAYGSPVSARTAALSHVAPVSYASPVAQVQESFRPRSNPPPAIPPDRIPPPSNAFSPPPSTAIDRSRTPSVPPPTKTPSVPPAAPSTRAASMPPPPPNLPDHKVLLKREQEPAPGSPLTYRELAIAVDPSVGESAAERLILWKFDEVRSQIADAPRGKLINLAVFDCVFEGRPPKPPIVALVWKDWRGPEPEMHFPTRPGGVTPSVAIQRTPTPPPVAPVAPVSQPPAPPSVRPQPAMPVQPSPQPAAAASAEPRAHATPSSPPRAASGYAAVIARGSQPQPAPDAPPVQPAMSPAPAVMAAPAPVGAWPAPRRPRDTQPAMPAALKAASQHGQQPEPIVQQAPVQPAPVQPAQVQQAPVQQAPVQQAPVQQAPVQAAPVPEPVRPEPEKPKGPAPRMTGDELITDLFESMHDLNFVRDTDEGAEFVLTLAMERFRSGTGMVQLYDINRREFVVMKAAGPNASLVMGGRTAERDPLITEIMRRRRPFVLDVARDGRVRAGRWAALGSSPKRILASAVELAGRFLGVIELGNPIDGDYPEDHVNGLAYVAERFAEFLAGRGVVFETETSAGPK